MTASYLIKTKSTGRRKIPAPALAYWRGALRRDWHTQAKAGTLEAAKLIAGQAGVRSDYGREAAIFHRGRIIARLAVTLAVLLVGCAPLGSSPAWTVEQDPNGLGYWAGPVGEPLTFYPSAYSNPIVNRAGGPDR